MSAVLAVDHYDPEDGGGSMTHIRRAEGVGRCDRHTVDMGDLAIGVPTHTTRDGMPMSVLYHPEHSYSVAVRDAS